MPRMEARSLVVALVCLGCQDATLTTVNDPPKVAFVRPGDGEVFDPLQAVEVCLTVTDETDLEDLTITLESDVDGVLVEGAASFGACVGGTLGVGLSLSDAPHRLTATVVDGRGEATAVAVGLVPTDDAAPDCVVASPLDGERVELGDPVAFDATVTDPDSPPTDLRLLWTSELDGVLYEGAPDATGGLAFSMSTLTAGEHRLTLAVTDPRGNSDQCVTVLTVDECTDLDLDGFTTCEGDCDDEDPSVYPDAPELLDGQDNDCDGEIDEDTDIVDDDGDGFSEFDGDCDDTDATVNPDATEVWYDGVDQDCDGESDYDQDRDGQDSDAHGGADCDDLDPNIRPGVPEVWYDGTDQDCDGGDDYDQDGDGERSDRFGGADCDDTDGGINPSATEVWYDGTDQDCDGANDYDQDGDGAASDAFGGGDCDDTSAAVRPGATEVWYDGTDQDCDGGDDYDQDGDGYRSDAYGGTDCADTNASVNPGATDSWYDGVDSDCDGADDYDQDGDGYQSDAYGGADCADTNASVNPGATDTWYDGVDSDCDGADDYDQDGDGYQSDAYGGTDCADTNASVNPGATEVWYDGTDQDCDGASDYDQDGDGYLSDSYGGSDCADTNSAISPGATEVWYDGTDQDCDGASDYDQDGDGDDSDAHGGGDCADTDATRSSLETEIWYDGTDQDCDGASDYDQDGDGEDSDAYGGVDCNDTSATINTSNVELLDGEDNDCDGYCDEGLLAAGDLVITEIMKDPSAVSDTYGEYFEVYNATRADITLCEGWEVYDDDTDTFVVLSDVTVPAGDVAVFGRYESTSANGGVGLDYVYGTGMQLANGDDELILYFDDPILGGFEMSRVEYLNSGWPDTSGRSLNLDPDFYDESSNDSASSWCHGSSTFGAGDVGTPGALNDEC